MPDFQECKAAPSGSRYPDILHLFFYETPYTAIRIAGCGNCRRMARYDFGTLTISTGNIPSSRMGRPSDECSGTGRQLHHSTEDVLVWKDWFFALKKILYRCIFRDKPAFDLLHDDLEM